MENASKAIIIAGGVLIGVLLLTMFLFVFRSAAKTNQSYDEKQALKQLESYNAKFEVYNKNNNSIMDLLTAINLAYDNNINSNYDPQNTVRLLIKLGENDYLVLPSQIISNFKKNAVLKALSDSESSENTATIEDVYSIINKSFEKLQLHPADSIKNDTFILTRLTPGGKTIYKYLFKCTNVDYHNENGKIAFMRFELIRYKYWDDTTYDERFSIYSEDSNVDNFYVSGIN